MLKRLRIDNFKSLVNFVFQPAMVNLLVGANNSGKTNLCQALNFLSLSSRLPIADAVLAATGETAAFKNVYLNKQTVEFECQCQLRMTDGSDVDFTYNLSLRVPGMPKPGQANPQFDVDSESLVATGGPFRSTTLLENAQGAVRLLHEGKYLQHATDHYVDTTAPTSVTMLNRLYDLAHNAHANAFKAYLSTWQYYDLDSCRLRSTQAGVPSVVLTSDGSNLSGVLFALKNIDERRYRELVHAVQEIEPKLEAINFVPPSQESVYMSIADATDHRFGPYSISTGTLRFLALAYVFLVAKVAAESLQWGNRLIMVEEPENGIYVGHLRRLFQLMDVAEGQPTQYVFTSHSPYFIDLFDKHPDGIHVLKSDGQHTQTTKPDPGQLSQVLDTFSLGEAHFRGLLG